MATALPAPCDETAGQRESEETCASPRGTLVATVLGSSLAFIVGSIINVALPAMRAEFSTDAAGVQWIVNAYLLPLSALILLGGAIGDHYGRKRAFILGLLAFAGATLGCALAPTFEWLLAARFVQGVGAAFLAPNSLAILADAFTGEERGKAIGTWAAAGAIAGAAAPLLGGFVVDTFDWRWAFAIVLPPAAACWLVAGRSIAESREVEGDRKGLDWLGASLATLALALIVFALILAPEAGWVAPGVLWPGLAGIATVTAFLLVENRRKLDAMIPLGIFGASSFVGISILTLLLYAALGGLLVVLPYMLINSFGYSATAAGAAILPFPLIMGLLSRRIGGLATNFGLRYAMTLGPLVVAAGFALFALLSDPDFDYWKQLLPGLVVMAVGMALCVAPLTTAVMNAVDARYTGVASGVNNATSRTAGLIATALLGFVMTRFEGDPAVAIDGFTMAAWVAAALAVASAAAAWMMIDEEAVSGRD